jgi:hypothetical protein
MTLQQPRQKAIKNMANPPILCHKCGAPIVFDKDHISPTTQRKVPLDPFFDNAPHAQYCMYFTTRSEPDTEALFIDFLSLVPNRRQKRVIGAVGKAK